MRNRGTTVAAGLAAALTMALAVGTASANTLSYSDLGFRIVWTTLTFSESEGNFPIRCPVTLEGSFHEHTFAKVSEELAGSITSASVGECQEGEATILEESLPWHVTYRSYSGELPNIETVSYNLIGAAFQVEIGLGIVCLAQSTSEFPAAGEAQREGGEGKIISLRPDSSLPIPVTGTNCPIAGIFSGSGEVHVQGSSEQRVRLTLA